MTGTTPAILPPWASIALVLGVLALGIGAIRLAQLRYALAPELARKGVHVTMSVVSISLPWLFDSDGPVALLASLAFGAMLLMRFAAPVRAAVGDVLHGVGRQSLGDLCFPLAVLALYLLAADTPVLYVIPLLMLGLADTAAALIGSSHGLSAYATVDGAKSHEGSVVFAFVAFLCVHVPLLLFSTAGRAEVLWIAAIVAILATLVEAISWRGLDNLFVPIGTYAVLIRLMGFSAALLSGHLLVLIGLLALAALLRRRTTISGAGIYGAALIGYLVWALGGTAWLVPPALVYVLYARIWPVGSRPTSGARTHTAHHVMSVSSVGMLWVLAAQVLDLDLFLPFVLSWAGYLAMLGVDQMTTADTRKGRLHRTWSATWRAALAVLVPALIVQMVWHPASFPAADEQRLLVILGYAAIGLVATAIPAYFISHHKKEIDLDTSDFGGRLLRAAIVGPSSAIGLLALALP